MMTYSVKSKEKVKKFAEVFTPPGIVFRMILLPEFIELLKDLDKTFFDPAVGEGQFPAAELVLKLFYNLDRLNIETAMTALGSLYGMDIQAESIKKCHAHMSATLNDAYKFFTGEDFPQNSYGKIIISENFRTGDSLKFMSDLAQPTLFEDIGA